jgi:hypothetical protein
MLFYVLNRLVEQDDESQVIVFSSWGRVISLIEKGALLTYFL